MLSLFCIPSVCNGASYRDFSSFYPSNNATQVNCLLQDDAGLIWLGTSRGLYSYNGYSTQSHTYTAPGQKQIVNTKVNCGLLLGNKNLLLGTDEGLLLYNVMRDNYEPMKESLRSDVRCLAGDDKQVWIGTINGLYCLSLRTGHIQNMSGKLPCQTIYSLLIPRQGGLMIGTYNGLFRMNKNGLFSKIEIPHKNTKNSLLVNALAEDKKRGCVWIGTEGSLFSYSQTNGSMESISWLYGNSVKTLSIDASDHVLAGTDNGLYVYDPTDKTCQHVVHDSRNPKSLINNIIWTVFVDRNRNPWFGTDYGVSYCQMNKKYSYVSIADITGLGDGNQLQCMYRDREGNLWLGGNNGLICSRPEGCSWYRMGDEHNLISHNRIRDIFQDKQGDLWVSTDGSINRFDYLTRKFVHYTVVDRTKTRNANWAYQMVEDKQSQLWIATCLGGVFSIGRDALLQAVNQDAVATRNFTQTLHGLSDNYILRLVADKDNNIWTLSYNNKLDKINCLTGKIKSVPFKAPSTGLINGNTTALICDQSGFIWIGYSGGVSRIDPHTNEWKHIFKGNLRYANIRSLIEEDEHIWASGPDGVYMIDKNSLKVKYIRLLNKDFSCGFYDSNTRQIMLGTVDGYVAFSVDSIAKMQSTLTPVITGILVNDRYLQAGVDYSGDAVRAIHEIELSYKQNTVSFDLSDLNYMQGEDNKYIYLLEGVDAQWKNLNTNRITYTNLSPGTYVLQVGINDQEGNPVSLLRFSLKITPPWYDSIWARMVYMLLVAGFIVWIIKYYMDKHRLRIERIDREKSLELSRLKIDFFTHVSHDFKTPLSLILGPVSQILPEIKKPQHKKQLELIRKNALHLNALIQQVIGFERNDNPPENTLILSQTELVEFCRGIYQNYEEEWKSRHLDAVFQSEFDQLILAVDVVKMESVINNILSNALKYSNDGGTILFSMNRKGENSLQITVADSGVGISPADLPFVFDRFYQSDRNKQKSEGSGIGLYVVKNFVELHHGHVDIESEEYVGTQIKITLPLDHMQPGTDEHEQSKFGNGDTEENKALLLVVEDNREVSDFIVQSLSLTYRCIQAYNGKSGFEKALSMSPDLIITDVMMPVMDGLEMCRLLQKHQQLSLIPVVMLTAKDDQMTEEKSIELGVSAFVPKPFEPSLLLLRINQLLHRGEKVKQRIRLDVISTPGSLDVQSFDEKFLADITRIIEDKIADSDLNVNRLSVLTGISSKQIYRRVKQLTGMPPVDYIRTIRLKKAAMLLEQRKFSVAEVMYLVGFSNYSYFAKCFQAKYGNTPKQFMDK